MIIGCNNCNKKFEVNSLLIPDSGRNIQCGSCNHTWFYKKGSDKTEIIQHSKIDLTPEEPSVVKSIKNSENKKVDQNQLNKVKKTDKTSKTEKIPQQNKSVGITLAKILSYLIVGIISFIALIIFLDTFKVYFSKIFPNLELFLFNLFETIKDILLFIKNLIL